MLTGRYYHTIDSTGRVSVPVRFREQLGNSPVLTRGLDGSLFLFSQQSWEEFSGGIQSASLTKKIHRDFLRLMTNDAVEVEYDKQGRILVPDYLLDYGELEREVVFAGSLNRVEIWNREKYHSYIESLEENAEDIAEKFEPNKEANE